MKTLSKEIFLKSCLSTHGNRYGYDNVVYVNMRTKIKINCSIHGEFLQNPLSHISGSGCKEQGIKLLHIRESLWINNKEKMKNVIIKFLKHKQNVH